MWQNINAAVHFRPHLRPLAGDCINFAGYSDGAAIIAVDLTSGSGTNFPETCDISLFSCFLELRELL